jgi:hypothetical protein
VLTKAGRVEDNDRKPTDVLDRIVLERSMLVSDILYVYMGERIVDSTEVIYMCGK